MNVSVNLNANIVLPTTITYDGAGYCNVNPVIDSIQLRFNQTDVFICTRTDQCDSENNYDLTVEYDFESKGDIVIESSPTFDNGSYIFGVVQSCPGVVLRMTYDIMSGIIPGEYPFIMLSSLMVIIMMHSNNNNTQSTAVACMPSTTHPVS